MVFASRPQLFNSACFVASPPLSVDDSRFALCRFTECHLKGLTKLAKLTLDATLVTDAGVANLQNALPNCKISYWHSNQPFAPK